MEGDRFEKMLRDALADEEPPAAADGRIRLAMRIAAATRRRRIFRRFAAAACLALLVGGVGLWQHGRQGDVAGDGLAVPDEGEIMLDIIGMADVDEFYALQVARL